MRPGLLQVRLLAGQTPAAGLIQAAKVEDHRKHRKLLQAIHLRFVSYVASRLAPETESLFVAATAATGSPWHFTRMTATAAVETTAAARTAL